jgi:hypothetical protein
MIEMGLKVSGTVFMTLVGLRRWIGEGLKEARWPSHRVTETFDDRLRVASRAPQTIDVLAQHRCPGTGRLVPLLMPHVTEYGAIYIYFDASELRAACSPRRGRTGRGRARSEPAGMAEL